MSIPEEMIALVANGPKDYGLKTVPVPKPAEDELLCRVNSVGCCASDVKMHDSAAPFYWGEGGRAFRGVIPGHEFELTVVKLGSVGAGITFGVSVGDRVVVEQLYACHSCWFCGKGDYHKCDSLALYGQGVHGAMAEYMIVKKGSFVHKVPESVPPYHGAFAEVLATSVRAVDRAGIRPGSTVAVAGCGAIGLGVVAALASAHPDTRIIAVDMVPWKLELARQAGASDAVQVLPTPTGATDAADAVRALVTDGRNGVDAFFECTGAPPSVRMGLDMVRKCGTFVHVSIMKDGTSTGADWNVLSGGKELTVIGVNLGVGCWPRALQLLADGKIPLGASGFTADGGEVRVLSTRPLQEWAEALDDTRKGTVALKTMLLVNPAAATTASSAVAGAGGASASVSADASESTAVPAAPSAASRGSSPTSLSGQVALVTGSSRGIGREIAFELARRGATVVIHGSTPGSPGTFGEGSTMLELASFMSEDAAVSSAGGRVHGVWGDLTTTSGVQRVVAASEAAAGGPIDILVPCAGGNIGATGAGTPLGGKPLADDSITVSEPDARWVMDCNLMTVVLTCQAVAPGMISRRRGRIVIIGSVAGTVGRPDGVMYAVAKAAVHEYARCLALNMRPHGICVNTIAPGPTATERYKRNLQASFDPARATQDDGALDRYGAPIDTARAVAALCGPDFTFVSGQVLRVDGALQVFPA